MLRARFLAEAGTVHNHHMFLADKFLHKDFVALRDIDVAIADGEFFCLLGPSGCGKSTLLNIMAGFEPASVGSVIFNKVEKSFMDTV